MAIKGFTSDENKVLTRILKAEIKKLQNFNAIEKQLLSPTLDKTVKSKVREVVKVMENMIFKIENLTNI